MRIVRFLSSDKAIELPCAVDFTSCKLQMSSVLSFKQIARIWKCLRQDVARVILSNVTYKLLLSKNIQAIEHVFELCDQYSLRILIDWLAQKSKFPAYRNTIDLENEKSVWLFETWKNFSNQFPFYSYPDNLEKKQFLQIFEYLNENLISQIDLIASLYEHILTYKLSLDANEQTYIQPVENGRLQGQFYTPNWVVEYCFELSLIKSKDITKMQILDPSCGAGKFLLGAFRHYLNDIDLHSQHKLVKDCLYGIDIDSRALSLCRISLILSLAPYWQMLAKNDGLEKVKSEIETTTNKLEEHIVARDSVIAGSTKEKQFDGRFDLVITNPPYISFGSRNQSRISSNWSNYLRQNYKEASQYKIRLHSIFQDISLRMVRDKGEVILFLPDAFLTGSYYANMRQLIVDKSKILSFTELPEKTMSEACVGRWCVAHYQKMNEISEYDINLYKINENYLDKQEYLLPKNILVTKDKNRFQLVFNDNDKNILTSLAHCQNLGSHLSGHTGIRAKAGKNSIIANTKKTGTYKKGITSGAQVTQHFATWDKMWINIVPEKLYGGGFDSSIVENPKILVRQTGDCIIAAVDVDNFYHLNNVHSFCLVEKNKTDQQKDLLELFFLVGLLNSRFWLYLYQLKSREAKRQLAQIDIEMLESLPIPEKNNSIERLIAKCARHLNNLYKNEKERGKQIDLASNLLLAIDSLVYKLYGFPSELIAHIESKVRAGNISETPPLPSVERVEKLLKLLEDGLVESVI